jgi:hypothetical protein
VDRETYDATIDFLGKMVARARVGVSEKKRMYEQLQMLLPGRRETVWMPWKP